jgi:hypothetical protein
MILWMQENTAAAAPWKTRRFLTAGVGHWNRLECLHKSGRNRRSHNDVKVGKTYENTLAYGKLHILVAENAKISQIAQ